jgi:hypothetical protein
MGGGGGKPFPSRVEREPEGGEAQEGIGRWYGVTPVLDATDSRVATSPEVGARGAGAGFRIGRRGEPDGKRERPVERWVRLLGRENP